MSGVAPVHKSMFMLNKLLLIKKIMYLLALCTELIIINIRYLNLKQILS